MAHAYSVAITKLDSVFEGRPFTITPHKKMSKKMYNKALTLVSNGKIVLAPLLARPSRLVKQFHPGALLLADWKKFNAKPTDSRPVEKDKKRQGALCTPSTSPAKKAKQPNALTPAPDLAAPSTELRGEIESAHSTNAKLQSSLDIARGEIKSLEDTVQVS